MRFSTDRDLLVFEPRVFSELAGPGQMRAGGSGNGRLNGAAFTCTGVDFAAAGIGPGMVLTITDGSNAGAPAAVAYEIITASSPQLTVSVLRAAGIGLGEPAELPIAPVAGGTDLTWYVASFAAQAEAVALEMLAHFALAPCDPSSPWTASDITELDALRAVSACGVLATVLAGAAQRADAGDGYWAKAVYYRGLFDRGLQRVRLGLGGSGDGRAEVVRDLAAPRLKRD